MPALFERDGEDLVPPLRIRQIDLEQPREASQDRVVHVVGPVGSPQNHDRASLETSVLAVVVPGSGDPVPERQKLRLDGVSRTVFRTVSGVQKGIELVDKNDRRRELARQAKNSVDELVGFSVPLVHDLRELDGQKGRLGFLGDRLGKHGFSRPGGAVQQDSTRGLKQSRLGKEFRLLQRQDGQLPDLLFLFVESPDVGKFHGNVGRIDDVLGDLFFVVGQGRNARLSLLLHELVQAFFGGRGCGLHIGVLSRHAFDELVNDDGCEATGGYEYPDLDGEFYQKGGRVGFLVGVGFVAVAAG
mmetsp:Transcript_92391/g.188025  ORF Transcript_92391/g.188025 Transcript_92391/m.188025 type:complete len:301 (+) Transcript_92391:1123-2025(+)